MKFDFLPIHPPHRENTPPSFEQGERIEEATGRMLLPHARLYSFREQVDQINTPRRTDLQGYFSKDIVGIGFADNLNIVHSPKRSPITYTINKLYMPVFWDSRDEPLRLYVFGAANIKRSRNAKPRDKFMPFRFDDEKRYGFSTMDVAQVILKASIPAHFGLPVPEEVYTQEFTKVRYSDCVYADFGLNQ